MLPHKLEIENINSFTDRQTIDFDAVSGDKIFCICGDTGAGKSTILDCIIIALYGMGTSGKSKDRSGKDDYININATKAYIRFEFSMDGKRYAVERNFSRSSTPPAYLYVGGEMVCRGTDEVNKTLEEIIGLGREQFTQVIILEQGKFSKFLNAGAGERTKTVTKLFKLERFDMYTRVNRYHTELKQKAEVLQARLDGYKEDTDARIAENKSLCKAREKERDAADKQLAADRKALAAEALKRDAYDKYLADADRAAACKRALEEAERALQALGNTDIAVCREQAAQAAERAQIAANTVEKYQKAEVCVREYSEISKKIEKSREVYKQLQAEKKAADSAFSTEKETNSRIKADLAAIMSDIQPLQTTVLGNTDPSDRNAAAQVRLTQARAEQTQYEKAVAERNAALAAVDALRAQADAAEKGYAAASERERTARSEYERAQKDSAKAVLTAGLQPGDPCPLCGGVLREVTPSAALTERKEAAEQAAQDLRAAERTRSVVQEKLRAAAEKAALPLPAQPTVAVAVCERFAELTARAKQLGDALTASDREILQRQNKADELAGKLDVLTTEGKGYAEQCQSLRGTIERDLGAFYAGEDFAAEKQKAERDAATAGQQADALKEKARQLEEQLKKANETRADAEGAYRSAAAAVKQAPPFDSAVTESLERRIAETEAKKSAAAAEVATLAAEIERMQKRVAEKRALEADKKALSGRIDTAALLARALYAQGLMSFVTEEYIRRFTAHASARLNELTGGKYTLEYDAEGEFAVRDFLNGNQSRRTQTLSGGETFLASLSLAVAISDELACEHTYGFFFLDEGFGTLDGTRIVGVSEALKRLSRDTLVGVVTHSPELTELIPAKLHVTAASDGVGSKVSF